MENSQYFGNMEEQFKREFKQLISRMEECGYVSDLPKMISDTLHEFHFRKASNRNVINNLKLELSF